jgi:hypothetical protein
MDDPESIAHALAIACATVREMLGPVEEAARGYREWLMQDPRNWTPKSAEAMSLAYFQYVMDQMSKSTE